MYKINSPVPDSTSSNNAGLSGFGQKAIPTNSAARFDKSESF